jgi:hypothetical protein
MYESLTRYLPEFEKGDKYGEWVVDRESKGTPDDPIQMPYVDFGPVMNGVYDAVYAFVDEHPEFELTRYNEILEKNGLEWDGMVMERADVTKLDGQAVMALLLGAIRADRFCEGALLGFFENGCVKRWLTRLKEIDEGE